MASFDPLSIGMSIGEKLIDHFFPDPTKKAEALLELEKLHQSGDLAVMTGQLDINKIEAGSPNLFIAGWRPFVGWVCGFGFAVQFVVAPTLTWLSSVIGHSLTFPSLDTGTLTTLLLGLLGMGGMRMYEKLQNVQGNH